MSKTNYLVPTEESQKELKTLEARKDRSQLGAITPDEVRVH